MLTGQKPEWTQLFFHGCLETAVIQVILRQTKSTCYLWSNTHTQCFCRVLEVRMAVEDWAYYWRSDIHNTLALLCSSFDFHPLFNCPKQASLLLVIWSPSLIKLRKTWEMMSGISATVKYLKCTLSLAGPCTAFPGNAQFYRSCLR